MNEAQIIHEVGLIGCVVSVLALAYFIVRFGDSARRWWK